MPVREYLDKCLIIQVPIQKRKQVSAASIYGSLLPDCGHHVMRHIKLLLP